MPSRDFRIDYFPQRFEEATCGWPRKAKAAYLLLLHECFMNARQSKLTVPGSLPNVGGILKNLSGATTKEWNQWGHLIEAKFDCQSGMFLNEMAVDSVQSSLDRINRNRKNARRRWSGIENKGKTRSDRMSDGTSGGISQTPKLVSDRISDGTSGGIITTNQIRESNTTVGDSGPRKPATRAARKGSTSLGSATSRILNGGRYDGSQKYLLDPVSLGQMHKEIEDAGWTDEIGQLSKIANCSPSESTKTIYLFRCELEKYAAIVDPAAGDLLASRLDKTLRDVIDRPHKFKNPLGFLVSERNRLSKEIEETWRRAAI